MGKVDAQGEHFDGVVVVGSGPNGLAAGIELLRAGIAVKILEAAPEPGGGLRSGEATLAGFVHDHCAAVHPMGVLSPFYKTLPLQDFGLCWEYPKYSAAHPLPDGQVALLEKSIDDTAQRLGKDAAAYRSLTQAFVDLGPDFLSDLMGPLSWPKRPGAMARFGWLGIRSATGLARRRFSTPLARALFAGCAAHSILPLEQPLTAALGLLFCLTGHWTPWPVVRGGSQNLARALVAYFQHLGGEMELERPITAMTQLPHARAYIFNTSVPDLLQIAGARLRRGERRALSRYRLGPGVYKVDYALSESIPWRAAECRGASTVHLGGTLEQISHSERLMWRGELSDEPFVMVCQQSECDSTRAPSGQHTGYAYLHVPHGYEGDAREILDKQIENYAPGFSETIKAAKVTRPRDFESWNRSFVGGIVTGGVADWRQAFFRPWPRLDPYRSSDPKIYFASAASPPGGGVHGMAGFHAARSLMRRWGVAPLARESAT